MRWLDLHTPSPRLTEALARGLIRVRALGGRRDYRRFVVVGVARTGSTLLLDLLNAQRRVLAFGELFRGDGAVGWDVRPFVTRQDPRLLQTLQDRPLDLLETEVFRTWPREVAAVGFKLFYYHARTGAQAAVWDHLRDDPGLAVLHIKRLNVLEQYLSLRVAHATNVWSSRSPPTEAVPPIRLDPAECRRHFEDVRAQEAACEAFFAGRRIETVTYEDLIADRAAVLRRVAGHLGVSAEPAAARIVRQRTRPVAAAIANYEELREAFAGSEWEAFFRRPDTLRAGREAA